MNTNTNAIAKMDSGEVVVADPFAPDTYHSAADVSALIKSANARLVERRRQFDALGEIGDAPLAAVKELRKAIADDDATLRDFDGKVKDALLDMSGFRAFITQTKGNGSRIDPLSVRGKFAAMLAQLKAREDAEKPAEPTHTYVMRLTCTDATLKAIIAKAVKAGAEGLLATTPQSDKAVKVIAKWFEENV